MVDDSSFLLKVLRTLSFKTEKQIGKYVFARAVSLQLFLNIFGYYSWNASPKENQRASYKMLKCALTFLQIFYISHNTRI